MRPAAVTPVAKHFLFRLGRRCPPGADQQRQTQDARQYQYSSQRTTNPFLNVLTSVKDI
jgi:hypothetical protein